MPRCTGSELLGAVRFLYVRVNLTRFAREKYDHFALRAHLKSLGISFNRTAATSPFFKYLAPGEGRKESLVIRKGIELLRKKSPAQCPPLERWLTQIHTDYAEDVLLVSEEVAEQWGRLMAIRTLPVIDGLLAATALVYDLTLATRNIDDFKHSGAKTFNPFA